MANGLRYIVLSLTHNVKKMNCYENIFVFRVTNSVEKFYTSSKKGINAPLQLSNSSSSHKKNIKLGPAEGDRVISLKARLAESITSDLIGTQRWTKPVPKQHPRPRHSSAFPSALTLKNVSPLVFHSAG